MKKLAQIIVDACNESKNIIDSGGLNDAEIVFTTPLGDVYFYYDLHNGEVCINDMQLGEEDVLIHCDDMQLFSELVLKHADPDWINESISQFEDFAEENLGCDKDHARRDDF